jgi:hypothetical protein
MTVTVTVTVTVTGYVKTVTQILERSEHILGDGFSNLVFQFFGSLLKRKSGD